MDLKVERTSQFLIPGFINKMYLTLISVPAEIILRQPSVSVQNVLTILQSGQVFDQPSDRHSFSDSAMQLKICSLGNASFSRFVGEASSNL